MILSTLGFVPRFWHGLSRGACRRNPSVFHPGERDKPIVLLAEAARNLRVLVVNEVLGRMISHPPVTAAGSRSIKAFVDAVPETFSLGTACGQIKARRTKFRPLSTSGVLMALYNGYVHSIVIRSRWGGPERLQRA